jgi:hypothetical protein
MLFKTKFSFLFLWLLLYISLLKNRPKCDEYLKKLNKKGIDYTQINNESFKFVIGIIQMTKTINYKDKITLGIVYCYLKKMNI